jgi:hypothetical protein
LRHLVFAAYLKIFNIFLPRTLQPLPGLIQLGVALTHPLMVLRPEAAAASGGPNAITVTHPPGLFKTLFGILYSPAGCLFLIVLGGGIAGIRLAGRLPQFGLGA